MTMPNSTNLLTQTSGFNVSKRYSVITTQDVIDSLAKSGWTVSNFSSSRAKKVAKQGYQKHVVRLRHSDLKTKVGDLFPEIVIYNSYDGTSSLSMSLGYFRVVCANGLIMGQSIEAVSIRHTGDVVEKVYDGTRRLVAQAFKADEIVTKMINTPLTEGASTTFANKVVKELLDEESPVIANELLKVRRYGDKSQDLFTVFNRIQENVIHGNFHKLTADGKIRKAAPIRSLERNIEINKRLWDIAEKFVA